MKKEWIPQLCLSIRAGYSWRIAKQDLWAGVTVGLVALPLSMAFAIASGLSPEKGLYTAIIGGFLISLLGGSHVQIGGPAGAFVVIVYGIIQRHGYEGLVLAMLIASFLLMCMGWGRLGTWIKYIPYPLTVGFTSAIAVIIFSGQIKSFFGLHIETLPADFLGQWKLYLTYFSTWNLPTCSVALGSLAIICFVRSRFPKWPWGILAVACATAAVLFFHLPVETIESRFGIVPNFLPKPSFPLFSFDFTTIQQIIPDAITIALLGGIESLLSAVVADGMTGRRHRSNCELVAQGFANLGSCLFSGMPATGTIARTVVNIKAGGQTPISGILHSLSLLILMIVCAPLVGKIPLAALAAVLITVAWNMSEIKYFRSLLRAPLGDVLVLLTTFLLTLFVDLSTAVAFGMILSAFLFMKRVSEMSKVVTVAPFLENLPDTEGLALKSLPEGTEVYEIQGPFLFGTAEHLKDIMHQMEKQPSVLILRMRKVPVLDATGAFVLKDLSALCSHKKTLFLLAEVQPQPKKSLQRLKLDRLIGPHNICTTFEEALTCARNLSESF